MSINNTTLPDTAIILAAGVGRRLVSWEDPKVLLRFHGKSLLERHIANLTVAGIKDIYITTGFRSEKIEEEVLRIHPDCQVHFIFNEDYRAGSLLSLWHQRDLLHAGKPLILMDGDVLYAASMLDWLTKSGSENSLLVDRMPEPGDEPVKICYRNGRIVDFHKVPVHDYDWYGESVGFFMFSAEMACELALTVERFINAGEKHREYEDAIRELILRYPDRFGSADITHFSWTEIDFDEDVQKAQDMVTNSMEGL